MNRRNFIKLSILLPGVVFIPTWLKDIEVPDDTQINIFDGQRHCIITRSDNTCFIDGISVPMKFARDLNKGVNLDTDMISIEFEGNILTGQWETIFWFEKG